MRIPLWLLLLLAALICSMGVAINFFKNKFEEEQRSKEQVIAYAKDTRDSLQHFINAWGRESGRAMIQDLTIKNLQALAKNKDLAWIRQFASVKKDYRNLESAHRTTLAAEAEFHIPFDSSSSSLTSQPTWWAENDSVYVLLDDSISINVSRKPVDLSALCPTRTFDNHNQWFRITGKVTPDSVIAHPYVPITTESVCVWERKHKLLGIRYGKKIYTEEISTTNPYVTIKQHSVIRVSKKTRR